MCTSAHFVLLVTLRHHLPLPLSEHEGGLGLGLVVNRRRAADDDGGPTVSSQRVLQDPSHLAVPVRDVAFLQTHNKQHTVLLPSTDVSQEAEFILAEV